MVVNCEQLLYINDVKYKLKFIFVRWEEERREDGVKWMFLEHKGPLFAPDYEPLPDNVIFKYDGNCDYFCLFF